MIKVSTPLKRGRCVCAVVLMVLVGCQPGQKTDEAPQVASESVAGDPGPLLGPLSETVFPPPEQSDAAAGAQRETLGTLIEMAEAARPPVASAGPAAPKIEPLNIASVTGAPERTQAGDYKRFKALSDLAQTEVVERNTPLVIRFDRGVVGLDEVGQPVKAAAHILDLWPEMKGDLKWTARDELTFRPAHTWAPGQAYYARIQKSPVSKVGRALIENFEWRFTARDDRAWVGNKALSWEPEVGKPRLVGWWPPLQSQLSKGQKVSLIFDQPVQKGQLRPHLDMLRVRAPGADVTDAPFDAIGFHLREVKKAEYNGHTFPTDHVVEIEPADVVHQGQSFQIMAMDPLLRPETTDKVWWLEYEVAAPLAIKEIVCVKSPCTSDKGYLHCRQACDTVHTVSTGTEIDIEFNNRVKTSDLKAHLDISPAPKSLSIYTYYRSYSLYLHLDPGQTYTVAIKPGLRDVHGFKLARGHKIKLKTIDRAPSMNLDARSGTLELGGPRTLPLKLVNVPEVKVRGVRIPADGLTNWLGALTSTVNQSPFFAGGRGQKLIEKTVATGTPPNKPVSYDLSLEPFVPKGPGIALVEVSAQPVWGTQQHTFRQHALVQITDLGLTVRQGPQGLLAWVTALSTGKPKSGVSVEVRDRFGAVAASGKTDDKGTVRFDDFDKVVLPVTLIAAAGDDMAFTRLLSSSDASIGLPSTRQAARPEPLESRLLAETFTDRGIYRPGQTVHAKILAREIKGESLKNFSSEPVHLEVTDPAGKSVLSKDLKLSAHGGADFEIELPERAPLGSWSYRVTLRAARTTLGWGGFKVEEYRPPRFEVSFGEGPNELRTDEAAKLAVEGRYLFGAPMAGASVEWRMERWPTSMWVKDMHGFSFRDPRQPYSGRQQIAGRREALDQQGKLSIGLSPSAHETKANGPWRYMIEAEVQDIDRQTVAARTHATVHDRDTYLGLRYEHRMEAKGTPLKVEVMAVDPDGKPRPGVQGKVKLIHTEWHNVEKRGPGGSYTTLSEEVRTEEATCTVRSARKPASCRFVPRKTGSYTLVVEGEDQKGRAISAGTGLYVYGEGYTSWRSDRPKNKGEVGRLELVPDKGMYAPGEVAKVMVKSPWRRSWALVTIERDRVISEHVVFLDGSAQVVEVPVTGAMSPNFYASVTVVRGRIGNKRDGEGRDRMAPEARTGRATLWVNNDARTLNVAVKAGDDWARPGDEVEVEAIITDLDGKPVSASATLWAVDEAVLQLTRYRTPDILSRFHGHRRLKVIGQDSRLDLLASRYAAFGRGEFGGDGTEIDPMSEIMPERIRRNFKTTLMFVGEVVSDEAGRVKTSVKLPDNLTMFRFMAVAADDEGRFGSGDARLRVRKPLMIRPALPRFVTVGDHVEISATVFNGTGEDGVAMVKIEAEGLEMTGAERLDVPVKQGANVEVRVKARATRLGDVLVHMEAAMRLGEETETDAVEVPLKVQYPGQWLRAYADGTAKGPVSVALDFPKSTRRDSGELEMIVSTSLLAGLSGTLEQLIEYPYGCVEQTTSRTYPMVMMQDLLPDLGVRRDQAEVRKMAQAGVDRLVSMVTPSGGLAYWPGGREPHAYGTAYGLMALVAARDKGFDVPPQVIDGAGRYLTGQLSNKALEEAWGQGAYNASRAFMLYALALTGHKKPGFAERLAQSRDKLSTDALGFLLLALHHGAGDNSLVSPVKTALLGRFEEVDGRLHAKEIDGLGDMRVIFHSNTKPYALALKALVETDTDHELAPRLAQALMSRRNKGHWLSTHGNLWGLAAIVAYSRDVEGGAGGRPGIEFKLGGEALSESLIERISPRTVQVKLPMDKVLEGGPESIEIARKDGKGRLYYTLKSRYLKGLDEADLKPVAHGMTVYRQYEDAEGRLISGVIPAGDVVRVKLYVQVPTTLNYVALDDPLPAGLEPINLKLATSGSYDAKGGGRYNHRGLRDGTWYFYHHEQRDDRVLYFADWLPKGFYELSYLARATSLGNFTAPPARAEAMYEPEVWGRSAMVRVKVQ